MITKFMSFGKKHMQQICRFSEFKKFENNFLATTNLAYIQSLYMQWKDDKKSVSPSFAAYFQELENGTDPNQAYTKPPEPGTDLNFSTQSPFVSQQIKLRMMIEKYRVNGHQFAKVDPLGLQRRKFVGALDPKILDLESFEFTPAQLKLKYQLKSGRGADAQIKQYTVEDMDNYLKSAYCSSAGYQYSYLNNKYQRDFMKSLIEQHIQSLQVNEPSKQEKLAAFQKLCKDQTFIDFLGNKFANLKRFGVEGLNSATSALQEIVEYAAEQGVQNIVMGMAHRGRINVLHCVFDKSETQIFQQFLQKKEGEQYSAGDVKYHLGLETNKKIGDKIVNLQMLPNPSHLQTVNPLVYGSVRAFMEMSNDLKGDKNLGVLVHGDAAMSGQGIMYQSLEMQDLVDYSPKGIIHIVMNNQIGFTTNPQQGRSSYYCTQIAKTIGAPVIHVNANEPAVLGRCMKIAVAFRTKFKKDVFIDIVGYRKHGHNEQDQPFFTQPKMYEVIKNKKSVFDEYTESLIQKGVLTKEQVKQRKDVYLKKYQQAYQKVINDKHESTDEIPYKFYKLEEPKLWGNKTGVGKDDLSNIFKKITTWPSQFNIHPTIKKIYDERIKNFQNNEPLDWATMESLAFGSLLHEGYGVRLSGQDVQRGTFSHRHAYISDQKRDVPKYLFLKSISNKVTVCNSHLSEYGVLGFQFGYSIQNPNHLTIWQAQFGDFANGASIMIDNYLVGCQSKWGIQSGLVMNLPHGMDGQGPEHSSGRMERFLQLCDDNTDVDQNISYQQQLKQCNIQIVCCSTASNYFHSLRRQIRRPYRKPLINFNSKKLLKLKAANRPASQIVEGTQFVPVYPDQSKNSASQIKRVILCNGQFYYELKNRRDELKLKDVAIVRIQQIAPFPVQHLKKVLQNYGSNIEYVWAQQQHQNYGAWNWIYPRLKLLLKKPIKFYGRNASAVTAVGALKVHKQEEQAILNQIFGKK